MTTMSDATILRVHGNGLRLLMLACRDGLGRDSLQREKLLGGGEGARLGNDLETARNI